MAGEGLPSAERAAERSAERSAERTIVDPPEIDRVSRSGRRDAPPGVARTHHTRSRYPGVSTVAFRLPRSPLARAALLLAVGAIAVLGYVGARGFLDRRTRVDELERLRSGLAELRAAAEECQIAVRREERVFEEYRAEVDSLRQEVREFEALDERGVPAQQYEAYLEAFDDYNESVPVWEKRADSLRAHSQACRALAERHNLMADSLRTYVEQVESGG